MPRSRRRFAVAVAAALLAAAPASAQESTVPAQIETRVREDVARRWSVASEDVILEFGPTPEGGLPGAVDNVELRGAGSGGHWVARLVTVSGDAGSVRVRAGLRIPVLVAARQLVRGEVLSASDMERSSEVKWGEPFPSEAQPEPGWVVQRVVRAGEALRSPGVQPPLAVISGKAVDVVWQRAGVGVRTRGRAAGSGPLGAEVYVRTESGERLRGVVVAPGVVDVSRGGTEG